MASTIVIRHVMTPDPVTVTADAPVAEAARQMKERDIGDVVVMDGGKVCGIITDRDIVIRAVAEDRDPDATTVGEICSGDPVMVSPTVVLEDAVELMRQHSLRRLPVVEAGKAIGIVSIGDLALERDPDSALADISAAAPNR